ncbi:T9SS type A sorting domain-containing protein [bacterium]|nr:T9SS type A sorting domain-containing protein [bacterium]
MKRFALVLLALFTVNSVFADDAAQTDWSGGDGVAGPVTDWTDQFDTATDVSWLAFPGELHLSSTPMTPVEHTVDGSFDAAWSVYSADIDDDGDMDILGAARDADDITWWENDDGSGTSWTEHLVDGSFDGAFSVFSADVDADGYQDILGVARIADDITWWKNDDGTGTSWTEYTIDGSFNGAYSVYAADVDADGYLDVLGAAIDADDITWWKNDDGTGTSWTEHTVDGSFDTATSVFAEDVNGDGYLDVLGSAYNADDITWWENNDGSGTSWTEHTVDGSFNGAYSVYGADIDGDGDIDMLGAARSDDDITWWENDDGSGTSWTEHLVDGSFDGAYTAYAADVDGDGDIDVLGAAMTADDITWWKNDDGSGTSWTEHTVAGSFDAANTVYAEDINGDGALDILGAAFYADDITWWEVTEFRANGNLTSSILDTAALPEWGQISWTADTPTNTTLAVEVRASNDSGSMGSWFAVSSGDELGSYLTDYDRYFQYKVAFTTTDTSASPTFEDITINWTDCTAVESVDLYANAKDEGVLLSWSIVGDTPATVSVLRGLTQNGSVNLSGELSGSATSWLDAPAEAGMEYAYWLEITELDGTVSRFGPSEIVVPGAVSELALSDPYPNPASSALTVSYELTQNGLVELNIYDLSGRLVETLVSGEQTAGRHNVSWDSSTSATGVYLIRLEAAGEAITKRAVISR